MSSSRPLAVLPLIALSAALLSGCASVKVSSTLKPGKNPDISLGEARFCIVGYQEYLDPQKRGKNNSMARWIPTPISGQLIDQRARVLYPKIFSNDWSSVPILIQSKLAKKPGSEFPEIVSGVTFGLVFFFPMHCQWTYSITPMLFEAGGNRRALPGETYVIRASMWVGLTPLCLLPIPGGADYRSSETLLSNPTNTVVQITTFFADCMVEAVVNGLRAADPALMNEAYRSRQSRLQQVTLDGKTYWMVLVAVFSQGFTQQTDADLFWVFLYGTPPTRETPPLEQLIVARRDSDGRWQPVTGYIHLCAQLTAVSVLMDQGVPSKAVLRPVENPPLEDFLDTPDLSKKDRDEDLRWSNDILLMAKNRTLPSLLQEKSRDDLLDMVTRIEKTVLDLNEKATQANDRAQDMVVKGAGDPTPKRNLAILLRQRIEILKPILGAIKQELSVKTN